MKKFAMFAIIIGLIAAPAAFGQDMLAQGSMEIGGSVGFASYSGDYYENADGDAATQMSFAPMVGYFVMDNLSVGAEINYQSVSQGDYSSTDFGLGPAVEYYLGNQMGPGYLFAHVGFAFGSSKWDDGTNDSTTSSTTITIAPGYLITLNDYVGVAAMLYYSMDSFSNDDWLSGAPDSGNQMGLRIALKVFK